MKKTIAFTLAMGTTAIVVAFVLKLMGWREALPLVFIGLLADLFALATYVALRYHDWDELPRRKLSVLILVVGGTLVVVGAILRIIKFPFSEEILYCGVISEFCAIVLYFSIKRKKRRA